VLLLPTHVVTLSSLFRRYPGGHIVAPHVASAPLRIQITPSYSDLALSTLLVSDNTAMAEQRVARCSRWRVCGVEIRISRDGDETPPVWTRSSHEHPPQTRSQMPAADICLCGKHMPGCRFFLRHTHDEEIARPVKMSAPEHLQDIVRTSPSVRQ
jgi:hypothetical protein